MKKSTTRRNFLKRTGRAVGLAIAAPAIVPSGVLAFAGSPGANERITLGFIGAGGRGKMLMTQTPEPGKIVAICDIELKRAHEAIKEKWSKSANWEVTRDYRRILDRKDIDAVVVPTTDHVRTLLCIHACQAGKDIYAEKPLTVTIAEGRALVNAVRKYERIFQTGTQQRSMEYNRYPCELVRTGKIGKIHTVQAVQYSGPRDCSSLPEEPIPPSLDWDAWCGPTELAPYSVKRHRGWMGCREYSGGSMTNWGAHGLDQLQWALGMDHSGPVEIWPVTEGPNGVVHMRYANGVLVKFELPKPWRDPKRKGQIGNIMGGAIFHGENGSIEIRRNAFDANPPELAKDAPEIQKREMWEGPGWQAKYHIADWLDCIKTRKLPKADVEIGHRSVSVCHLANIAREIGRKVHWDPKKEVFKNDAEANTYLDRPRRAGYELPDPV